MELPPMKRDPVRAPVAEGVAVTCRKQIEPGPSSWQELSTEKSEPLVPEGVKGPGVTHEVPVYASVIDWRSELTPTGVSGKVRLSGVAWMRPEGDVATIAKLLGA